MPKGDATKSRHAAAYRAKALAPPPTCEPTAEQGRAMAAVLRARDAWLSHATVASEAAYLLAQQVARKLGVAWVQVEPGRLELRALATAKKGKRRKGWSFLKTKETQANE